MYSTRTLCEVETVRMNFQSSQQQISCLVLAALSRRSTKQENLDFSKKNSAAQKLFVRVAKHTAVMTHFQNIFKFSSKCLINRTIEDSFDGPMSKYREVLEEEVNVTSTNRGFRSILHAVATYDQSKKGLSYFHPKRNVQEDGLHTRSLNM